MNPQILTEVLMIGTILALTLVGFRRANRAGLTRGRKAQTLLTGLLGSFILLAGTAKFFDPFATMFAKQIAYAELPFPELANWLGHLAELGAGGLLLAVFLLGWGALSARLEQAFYAGNALVMGTMAVALYVHFHPGVPAEVLPMQMKAPVITVITLVWSLTVLALHRRNSFREAY